VPLSQFLGSFCQFIKSLLPFRTILRGDAMDRLVSEVPESLEHFTRPGCRLSLRVYFERHPVSKKRGRIALTEDDGEQLLFPVCPTASKRCAPLSFLPRSSAAAASPKNDVIFLPVDGTRTYTRDNVYLATNYEWRVP